MSLEDTIREHVAAGIAEALERLNLHAAPGRALKTSEVAERLGVTPDYVLKLIKARHIVAWRTQGDSGDWRINESDLHAYQLHQAAQARN